MSETLTTRSLLERWPYLGDFLAAGNWGPLRRAFTEQDRASRGRAVLGLVFPPPTPEYPTPIINEETAASAYGHIVEYLIKHGYDNPLYFEQGRISLDLGYGGFHRRTDDLKRDLGIFEPDLPPLPAPIDFNQKVKELGLSEAAALKALQREAAQQAAQRKPKTRRQKWPEDARPDENPAAFAWRAYQAEAKAGTLHLGVIRQDDKKNGTELAVKLVSWLRSPANREQVPEDFDIPTKPEWITRQAGGGKAQPSPLYSTLATRRWRERHRTAAPGGVKM